MEYQIIGNSGKNDLHGETADEFEEWINEFISDGWQPLGGVSFAFMGDSVVFYQAMVRPNNGLQPTAPAAKIGKPRRSGRGG